MHYWHRYGAMVERLGAPSWHRPGSFLWYTHQFPDLPMALREPHLRHVLKALPGRKVVFSNAPQHYAQAVLKQLRVADLFDDVMTVE